MRLIIIKDDTKVSIDGLPFEGIDMSNLPANFHALQWYETWGDAEYKDPVTGRMSNENVTDLTPYQPQIDAWYVKKAEYDAENGN